MGPTLPEVFHVKQGKHRSLPLFRRLMAIIMACWLVLRP